MSEIEKVTTNVSVVDLGQIDLLVQQGFYTNRTDFFRTAIRNQLTTHADVIKQTIVRKNRIVGIMQFSQKELEEIYHSGEQLDLKIVGMLMIDKDVSPELIRNVITSVEVHGVIRASQEVKDELNKIMDNNFFDKF